MSNLNDGVGQWDKTSDLEWRLKQMQDDMNIMWSRLNDLEVARDEKLEPYDVMNSFRATNKDAGEPVNRHYIDCLKQNARLIEENDVLRYQYEAMKNETMRCKEQVEKLQLAYSNLRWFFDNQPIVEKQTARKCLAIVSKIKNEPLTTMSTSREWMVAICEDIERVIKQEFGLK